MSNSHLSFLFVFSLICLLSSCKKEECMSCQLSVPALGYDMSFPDACGTTEELDATEEDYRNDESLDDLIEDGIPYFINCFRMEQ